ncbi:MAG: MBL fold metallo-hydrolase [Gammaproteobacteria bacterium]|nr:MBL fold metallo-hydrolase [Gammaproteobacteria bacterium]
MKSIIRLFLSISLLFSASAIAEKLVIKPVADRVWAIVGPLTNRSPENLGNNATFGVVETDAGVVLIDSGGSYKGAKKIHDTIRSVSDQPIKYVINSGGQDHRWFGNDYFSRLGATIISSQNAREDHEQRLVDQIGRLTSLIGDESFAGTREKYADELFDDKKILQLGGVRFELVHAGQAHTPGDSFIWLADRGVMFSGDIVYVERMLGVGDQSNSKTWVEVFEAMASYQPKVVVPGHGNPVPLATAQQDTYRYLTTLREKVGAFLDDGGDASEISKVDMSEFSYLFNYDSLNGRNALKVFTELEWE